MSEEKRTYPPMHPIEAEKYAKAETSKPPTIDELKGQDAQSGIDKSDSPSRKKYEGDQPSDDIDPEKAKKILTDKTVKGHPLTEDQENMFQAAAHKND